MGTPAPPARGSAPVTPAGRRLRPPWTPLRRGCRPPRPPSGEVSPTPPFGGCLLRPASTGEGVEGGWSDGAAEGGVGDGVERGCVVRRGCERAGPAGHGSRAAIPPGQLGLALPPREAGAVVAHPTHAHPVPTAPVLPHHRSDPLPRLRPSRLAATGTQTTGGVGELPPRGVEGGDSPLVGGSRGDEVSSRRG